MVLCVFGFPSKEEALKFEWAWQHPDSSQHLRAISLALKGKIGRRFQVRAKIRFLFEMVAGHWRSMPLTINFFEPEFLAFAKDCPALPAHVHVDQHPMDEFVMLHTFTESGDEGEDDGDNTTSGSGDEEEPDSSNDAREGARAHTPPATDGRRELKAARPSRAVVVARVTKGQTQAQTHGGAAASQDCTPSANRHTAASKSSAPLPKVAGEYGQNVHACEAVAGDVHKESIAPSEAAAISVAAASAVIKADASLKVAAEVYETLEGDELECVICLEKLDRTTCARCTHPRCRMCAHLPCLFGWLQKAKAPLASAGHMIPDNTGECVTDVVGYCPSCLQRLRWADSVAQLNRYVTARYSALLPPPPAPLLRTPPTATWPLLGRTLSAGSVCGPSRAAPLARSRTEGTGTRPTAASTASPRLVILDDDDDEYDGSCGGSSRSCGGVGQTGTHTRAPRSPLPPQPMLSLPPHDRRGPATAPRLPPTDPPALSHSSSSSSSFGAAAATCGKVASQPPSTHSPQCLADDDDVTVSEDDDSCPPSPGLHGADTSGGRCALQATGVANGKTSPRTQGAAAPPVDASAQTSSPALVPAPSGFTDGPPQVSTPTAMSQCTVATLSPLDLHLSQTPSDTPAGTIALPAEMEDSYSPALASPEAATAPVALLLPRQRPRCESGTPPPSPHKRTKAMSALLDAVTTTTTKPSRVATGLHCIPLRERSLSDINRLAARQSRDSNSKQIAALEGPPGTDACDEALADAQIPSLAARLEARLSDAHATEDLKLLRILCAPVLVDDDD